MARTLLAVFTLVIMSSALYSPASANGGTKGPPCDDPVGVFLVDGGNIVTTYKDGTWVMTNADLVVTHKGKWIQNKDRTLTWSSSEGDPKLFGHSECIGHHEWLIHYKEL